MKTKHIVARQLLDKVEKAGGEIGLTEKGEIRYHLPGEQSSRLVEELRPYRLEIRSLLIARLPPLWGRDRDGYGVQPTTEQLIDGIQARGGRLWLDNYHLHFHLPKKNLKELKGVVKQHRSGVFHYLLARLPKIEIPVACGCDRKPYPHLTHDPPRGDEQPDVRVKGDLQQLREALIRCQTQAAGWDMGDLIKYLDSFPRLQ